MPAHFPSDAAVSAIGSGLVDCSLPKAQWTHAAHFAAAVWMMRDRPDLLPTRDLPPIIRAYNLATGVPNTDTGGYHETITQASLRAARAFLDTLPRETALHVACNRLLASPLGRPDWLMTYWSRPVLFSVAARRAWLEPDIQPLPF